MYFTVEEENLICLHHNADRRRTAANFRTALPNMDKEMAVLACQCCDSKTVVLTGSMTTLPQAVTNFQLFEKLYGIHYIIPENATFATAIGAGLYSLQKKPEA